jgi:hypothetical protein
MRLFVEIGRQDRFKVHYFTAQAASKGKRTRVVGYIWRRRIVQGAQRDRNEVAPRVSIAGGLPVNYMPLPTSRTGELRSPSTKQAASKNSIQIIYIRRLSNPIV